MNTENVGIENRKPSKMYSALLALPLLAGIATNSFAQERTTRLAVIQPVVHVESSTRRAIEIALAKTGMNCDKVADAIGILEAVITGKKVVLKRNIGGYGVMVYHDRSAIEKPLEEQVGSYSLTFGDCSQARTFATVLRTSLNGTGKNVDILVKKNAVTVTNIAQ